LTKHLYMYTYQYGTSQSMVRPHLEFGTLVWHPQTKFKKDQEISESVQHRGTKLVPVLSKLSYEERLRQIGSPLLSYRRLRGDLHYRPTTNCLLMFMHIRLICAPIKFTYLLTYCSRLNTEIKRILSSSHSHRPRSYKVS